jgi:hypothetical protein
MDNDRPSGPSAPEKLISIAKAAEGVGAKYWQIQRLVRRNAIPSYKPYNSRPLVKLSEVVAYIDSSRQGGSDER